MRADPRRFATILLAAGALAMPVGCGSHEDPFRVGVLVDCVGILQPKGAGMLAGAELPFRERDFSVGGRKVELVKGCTEVSALTNPILAARRLIEDEGVDVVMGPVGDTEGVVMRDLAARYPDVTFILAATAAQDATLRKSQQNVFRFVADGAQSAAGLASYAYRDLGWRRAAVAFDYVPSAWEATAGFVAEFCSLGGRVDVQGAFEAAPPDRRLAGRMARQADGVFLSSGFYSPGEFLTAYDRAVTHLSRRLILNGYGLSLPQALTRPGVDLTGVVLGGDIPFAAETPDWRHYIRALETTYPDLPPGAAHDQVLVPYYVGAEGLARALNEVDGDTGVHGKRLRSALARVRFDGPMGPIRLDSRRQAIVSVHLRRLVTAADRVTTRPVRVVPGVDESYSGIFTPTTPTPSAFALRCRRGEPPAWARG